MKKLLMSGNQLKAARVLAGLTQQQLADDVGLHKNSISYYERQGRGDISRMSYMTRDRIVAAFQRHGVTVFGQPSPGVMLVMSSPRTGREAPSRDDQAQST